MGRFVCSEVRELAIDSSKEASFAVLAEEMAFGVQLWGLVPYSSYQARRGAEVVPQEAQAFLEQAVEVALLLELRVGLEVEVAQPKHNREEEAVEEDHQERIQEEGAVEEDHQEHIQVEEVVVEDHFLL
jgi:hypothetical protein